MNTQKLRYEGFTVGQRIRALDFEPREGRGDCYIEGPIMEVCREGAPARGRQYAHYVIQVEREVFCGEEMTGEHSRVGSLRCVPMQSDCDYQGRVTGVVTYAVYRKPSGEHFFNPAPQNYSPETEVPVRVGGVVNGCECVYVGDLETAERVAGEANSKLPQTSIDELLHQSGSATK
jgi:hypothetical protein